MYNISPNNSFASNYQVGRGEDQILDTSTAENALQTKVKQQEAERVARAKKLEDAKKRSTDLLNNKLGEVRPADIPYFKDKQKAYSDAVVKAFQDGGGDISIDKEAELNQIYNSNIQEALASKNKGDQENVILSQLSANHTDYRDPAHLKFHDSLAAPSNGNYGAPVSPNKIYNIEEKDVKPLAAEVKALAESNKVNGKKEITPQEAYSYASGIADNPHVAAEILDQFHSEHPEDRAQMLQDVYLNPKTKVGQNNPSYVSDPSMQAAIKKHIDEVVADPDKLTKDDYHAITGNHFVDRFTIYGKEREPKGNTFILGGSSDRGRLKTHIDENGELTTDTGTGGETPAAKNMDIRNPGTGEEENRMLKTPVIQFDPKTGDYVGGKYTILPTKEQEDKNDIVKSQNKTNYDDLQYYLREYKSKNPVPERKDGFFGTDTDAEYKAKVDKWKEDVDKKTKALEAEYPQEKMPYPEKVVPVNSNDKEGKSILRKLYQNTYGGTIEGAKNNALGHDYSSDFKVGSKEVVGGKKDQTKVDNKAKGASSYTKEQEAKIAKNMASNPAYSREEIIKALGY